MTTRPETMVELWRGGLLESWHVGHGVVCDGAGQIRHAWGDPDAVIFPRSSCKMIQALPMVESGAAAHLRPDQLALACASHKGAPVHVNTVNAWLADLGLGDGDLRCGTQISRDPALNVSMIRAHEAPCQVHNECSGKHTGFLTLSRHLRAGPEYVEQDHPVQIAARQCHEDVTGLPTLGVGIDGCSAPNFATTVHGLARAMASYATATETDARGRAMVALRNAMMAHPEMVGGEGSAATELMRAMGGGGAVKSGAEGVFVAILPGLGLGVALKIGDGAERAAACAAAAILVALGVLDPNHPSTRAHLGAPLLNRAGLTVGSIERATGFCDRPLA